MAKRRKLMKKLKKKVFAKGASKTKPLKLLATPMRGGFRI